MAKTPNVGLSLVSVETQAWPAQYHFTLTVPESHHAYLDEGREHVYIPITVDSQKDLTRQGWQWSWLKRPEGIYDEHVKATVLRGEGRFAVSIQPMKSLDTQPANLTLPVRYQLCNDLTHVCFRPKQVNLKLPLPDLPPEAIQASSMTERLLSLFADHQEQSVLIFGLMLLAGLLSVATPCVYPMLPITAMLISQRAGGQRRGAHALAYLLGIVATYSLLGLIAGMTGGAFNSFMQSAWVNLAFAVFFALFALSMLGYYQLSVLQNQMQQLDQRSAGIYGVWGTGLMGAVAGLVISPCVGPIVFALLLNVADRIAAQSAAQSVLSFWDTLGIASEGGVMMAGFGLGVALPFFLLAILDIKLPKAGYWMNKVKYGFGLVILYFAYTYLHKALGVLGAADHVALMLAVALVVLWFAVVNCNVFASHAQDSAPGQKLHRYCGVIALLLGGWLFIHGLDNVPLMATAQAQAKAPEGQYPPPPVVEGGITWYRNLAAAQQAAQSSGKPIFIDFYAAWCANCVAFRDMTQSHARLNQALREQAIALELIEGEPDFEAFKQRSEHRSLQIGLPYFAILTPDGHLSWSGTDYQAVDVMLEALRVAHRSVEF